MGVIELNINILQINHVHLDQMEKNILRHLSPNLILSSFLRSLTSSKLSSAPIPNAQPSFFLDREQEAVLTSRLRHLRQSCEFRLREVAQYCAVEAASFFIIMARRS